MDSHYFPPSLGGGGFEDGLGHSNLSAVMLPRVPPTTSTVTEASLYSLVPFSVHYGVTIFSTLLVGILFVVVYVQLIMVICFGYKLISYQTILLFDILLWASLRLTLFSFYYFHCCELANKLNGKFSGWILVALPSALQYFSLAVLVHYFGEVYCC